MTKEYWIESSWSRIYKIEKNIVSRNFDYCNPLIFSGDSKKLMLEEPLKGLLEKKVKDHIDPFKTATCIVSLHLLELDDNVIQENCFFFLFGFICCSS